MKLTSAIFLTALATMILPAQQRATAAELPAGSALLEQAMKNMVRLGSYHISVELHTPAGQATLEGDLGPGTLSFQGQDPKGVRKQRIVVDKNFFLSLDGGKTWKTGNEADRDGTIFLSKLVSGPISPELKIWEKGNFTTKEEKVAGESLLRVEKAATAKEPAVIYWLVREPKLGNAVFIRKATLTIESQAGTFPETVTYTKLNQPVEIKAPVPAK